MRGKRQFPRYIPGTARQWKARKRREARDLKRALEVFRLGCAYTPIWPSTGGGERRVDTLDRVIKDILLDLSIERWGR